MAKEIVTWCDPCLAQDMRTPSRQYGPFLGKTIDLCDPHAEEFVKPLQALVEEFGAPVELTLAKGRHPSARVSPQGAQATLLSFGETGIRKGRKPPEAGRQWKCLWCPMDYAADSGFRAHLASLHGLAQGLAVFSSVPCPLCGIELHSLGSHITRGHTDLGFRNVTEAFIWARDNGDPHGSYAALLAKAPVLS